MWSWIAVLMPRAGIAEIEQSWLSCEPFSWRSSDRALPVIEPNPIWLFWLKSTDYTTAPQHLWMPPWNLFSGTTGSIWADGDLPKGIGDVTNITACVRVTGHCCASSWGIKAKKCKKGDDEFYVYYLRRPGGCFAYCAGMIFLWNEIVSLGWFYINLCTIYFSDFVPKYLNSTRNIALSPQL